MIDKKFAIKEFCRANLSSSQSKVLSEELTQEIESELHLVVLEKVKDIVNQLNSLGHNLTLYGSPTPGDISYRDREAGNNNKCNLRLGVDVVVSIGFDDLVDDIDDDQREQNPIH